ncbi:UDP-2,3-diacylglucosamine diphosphatase [Shigella flexneri]
MIQPAAPENRYGNQSVVDSGVPCYFIHGNRDFLIGKRFARDSGMQLPEEKVLNLYGRGVLIMHGDTLCTDDPGHRRFAPKFTRRGSKPCSLPCRCLSAALRRMRNDSKAANSSKSMEIMDVNPQAVVAVMEKHRVQWLIHGHTHRRISIPLAPTANGAPRGTGRLASPRLDGESEPRRRRTYPLPVLIFPSDSPYPRLRNRFPCPFSVLFCGL